MTLLGLAAWALFPCTLLADTIYLKSGRKIVAEIVREDSKQIFIERGGGEVAIPRTIVERVERSTGASAEPDEPGGDSGTERQRALPLPPPPGEELGARGSEVIRDNAIDKAYLQQLDGEVSRDPSVANLHRLAQGYQEAAIFLTRQGNPEGALDLYRHALRLAPDDLALNLAMAYLLVKQTYYGEAISLLLPLEDRHPQTPAIPLLLGSAYYATEDLDRAVAEWNKSLALQDDPRLREAVAKAEQEQNVAGSYLEQRSEHFLLRYEGREVEGLIRDLVNTLEAAFRDLSLDLDYVPHETIIVLLYPDQSFRDITRSASWVGALNDGKIRIPVSGLKSMTPELARVLKHELTHSFVRQITVGRCPTWFNEGLAQLGEGATTTGLGTQLARAFVDNRLPTFAVLEGSFMDLSGDQVGLAYAKSLAALEYLRDTFGMGEVRRLLKLLPASSSVESLLQDELRMNYSAFEQEVANYIVKRYGA
ncbi:MAG: tetratricopeptide repeat protein [Acidobacteriia bacterium]|nr:tetratricopeptide repeat protein [Terriglobia bacterium]